MLDLEPVEMRDDDWASLVGSIEAGNCTLMLGPDAFNADIGGRTIPVAVGLAQFVRERLGTRFDYLDPNKPYSVAQVAVAEQDAYTLQRWVREFYDTYDTTSPALRNLAALPFPLIVNTSPGFTAENAFRAARPNIVADYYDRTARVRNDLPEPSAEAPVLYNLYGSLRQPLSLILSESDCLDFLVSVISGVPPLPTRLTSALQDPGKSFLFLGFNLRHWQLRALMHVLARNAQRRYRSFAFELAPALPDGETLSFYRIAHKVSFFSMDLEGFATNLRSRVSTDAVRVAAPDEPDIDAPVVFICHAHEDKSRADSLADELRSHGLRAWLDQDDLRGGDQWDDKIGTTIEHEVDYVVVLQSANLEAKSVGYVNKEIALALDRQTYYRPPRVFVIPAIIDAPEHALDHLLHLQSVDLTTETGVIDLVRIMKRDQSLASRAG